MGALTVLLRAFGGSEMEVEERTERWDDGLVRCRNCGRYYGAGPETCPHCGSANQLRGGPPAGQTRT